MKPAFKRQNFAFSPRLVALSVGLASAGLLGTPEEAGAAQAAPADCATAYETAALTNPEMFGISAKIFREAKTYDSNRPEASPYLSRFLDIATRSVETIQGEAAASDAKKRLLKAIKNTACADALKPFVILQQDWRDSTRYKHVLAAWGPRHFAGLAQAETGPGRVTSTPPADAQASCDNPAIRGEILELLNKDRARLIPLQYRLVSLKLAREALKARGNRKHPTVENAISQMSRKLWNDKKTSPDLEGRLLTLYREHGRSVGSDGAALLNRLKDAQYATRDQRLTNADLAGFIHFQREAEGNHSLFSESDEAVLWLMGTLKSAAPRGRQAHPDLPLLEASQLAARYTGAIAGARTLSSDDLTHEISAIEAQFESIFAAVQRQVLANRTQCQEILARATCSNCSSSDVAIRRLIAGALPAVIQAIERPSLQNGEMRPPAPSPLTFTTDERGGLAIGLRGSEDQSVRLDFGRIAISPTRGSTTPSSP